MGFGTDGKLSDDNNSQHYSKQRRRRTAPNITAVEQGPEEGKQVPETATVVLAEGNSDITCYQCSTLRLDRSLIISSPKLSRALLIDPTITSPAKTCSENGKIRLQPFTERYPNPTRGPIQETSTRENGIIHQQITMENVLSLKP